MTVHHADFAIPVSPHIEVTTSVGVSGRVVAIGWWVQPESVQDPNHEPAGTLYLVVDPDHPRPMWVAQGALTSTVVHGSD